MKVQRGELTALECKIACVLCIVACLLIIFVPMFITPSDNAGVGVVPQYGTVEYEKYIAQFAIEHGREWNVHDQVIATYNGMFIIIGVFGIPIAICSIISLIHDLYCWKEEKKCYALHITNELPLDTKTQICRCLLYLTMIILFGSFLYFIAPLCMMPIPH